MVWLKSTERRPLGQQTEKRMATKDIICAHTMVGFLLSTAQMFRTGGFSGTESHFGIGGKWGSDKASSLDGVVWQFQDTDFEADANLEGAHHVISIETADNAPRFPKDIERWTDKQADAIVNLIAELCTLYDIPPLLIPDTKPGRRGLAYHAQGISPNLVKGGEKWSLSPGKECPGPARIAQFKNEIIPAVQRKLEKDMDLDDKVKYTTSAKERLNKADDVLSTVIQWPPAVRFARDEIAALDTRVAAMQGVINLQMADQKSQLNTLQATVKTLQLQNKALADAMQELLKRIPVVK